MFLKSHDIKNALGLFNSRFVYQEKGPEPQAVEVKPEVMDTMADLRVRQNMTDEWKNVVAMQKEKAKGGQKVIMPARPCEPLTKAETDKLKKFEDQLSENQKGGYDMLVMKKQGDMVIANQERQIREEARKKAEGKDYVTAESIASSLTQMDEGKQAVDTAKEKLLATAKAAEEKAASVEKFNDTQITQALKLAEIHDGTKLAKLLFRTTPLDFVESASKTELVKRMEDGGLKKEDAENIFSVIQDATGEFWNAKKQPVSQVEYWKLRKKDEARSAKQVAAAGDLSLNNDVGTSDLF